MQKVPLIPKPEQLDVIAKLIWKGLDSQTPKPQKRKARRAEHDCNQTITSLPLNLHVPCTHPNKKKQNMSTVTVKE